MKKLLSFCLLMVGMGTMYAERLYITFNYTVDNPIVTSMDVEKRFDRISERPMHSNHQNYDSVTFRFVDDNSEAIYTLTYYQANKLGLVDINVLTDSFSTEEHDSLDLAEPQYQYLTAESFGLIMRLLKEGVEAPTFEFSAKSVDSFLRKVVAEGNASNKLVLGCKTPLTLALKLAHIFSCVPLQSRLGDMCMALAVSNEYLRMDTPEDVEIISQMEQPIKRHINAAYNDFLIPCWTCIKALTGHGDIVWSVAFSPNGKHVASGDGGRAVRICDVSGGICIKTLTGHGDRVWSVAFSPDGKYIASGSGDNTVRIWDVSSGICMKTLEGHGHWVWSVAFSPDGKYLASGSYDGVVRIWDVSSGICIKTLTGNLVNSVAFSPDGKYIASGRGDRTVRIWDVSSGDCIKTLEGHENWVRSVTFSPDGKYLASGSGDNTVRVWDLSSGICIKTLEGHGDIVWSVAFSPDGKYLASGCSDRTVRIWDVNSGACIKTLEGHGNWVKSVTFSPDGKHVASGGDDETVRIWGAGDEFDTLTFAQRWGFMVANAKNPFKNRSEMVLQVNMLKDLKKVEYKTPMHVSACSLARPVLLASARHLPSAFRQISVLMSQRAPADVVQRFFKAHEREFGTRRNEVGADVVRYTQEFLRERRAERLSGASSSKDS